MNFLGISITGVGGAPVAPDLDELQQKTQNQSATPTETTFSGGITADHLTVSGSLRSHLIPAGEVDLGTPEMPFKMSTRINS